MPHYRLTRRYFSKVLHPKDSVLEFEEGKQPSSAIRVDGPDEVPIPDTVEPAGTVTEPVLDTPQLELGLSELSTLSEIAAGKKK